MIAEIVTETTSVGWCIWTCVCVLTLAVITGVMLNEFERRK